MEDPEIQRCSELNNKTSIFGNTPEELRDFYDLHYRGMSRKEVKDNDPDFYEVMDNAGLLSYIPLQEEIENSEETSCREKCINVMKDPWKFKNPWEQA